MEYKSKWEKFQAAKWQATDEQKSVREMERVMDVELFLGIQDRWAEDSPHCTWSYCMRCSDMWLPKGGRRQNASSAKAARQTLPQLNPEAGVPAIQLVGPGNNKGRATGAVFGSLQAT